MKIQKIFIIIILFLNNIVLIAQEKNEIYVHFDKEYPGKIIKDTSQTGNVTFYLEDSFPGEYLAFEVINGELKEKKKSFLRKANILKISNLLCLDWKEIVKVFENKKVYLIDSNQLKKKKVVIKELKVRTGISYEM